MSMTHHARVLSARGVALVRARQGLVRHLCSVLPVDLDAMRAALSNISADALPKGSREWQDALERGRHETARKNWIKGVEPDAREDWDALRTAGFTDGDVEAGCHRFRRGLRSPRRAPVGTCLAMCA
jgi:hypothetical protein